MVSWSRGFYGGADRFNKDAKCIMYWQKSSIPQSPEAPPQSPTPKPQRDVTLFRVRVQEGRTPQAAFAKQKYWREPDKYLFIKNDTSGVSKDKLCRILEVTRGALSGVLIRGAYYAWLEREMWA